MNPLLSVLDRWIDANASNRSASVGSTDCSSNDDEDETITFIERDGSASSSNPSTIGTKLDRISFHARGARPTYIESIDRSIQSSMGPSAQSSMGRSSAQSSPEQSVQEASIHQMYDTRELRKVKLTSRKLFDKNRSGSIRERLIQAKNRQQSEEGRKTKTKKNAVKETQLPMNGIFVMGTSSARKPEISNKYKSKRWTKGANKRSMQNMIPSWVVTESVLPDLTIILEEKAVMGTDHSTAKSYVSSGVETETPTKESADDEI